LSGSANEPEYLELTLASFVERVSAAEPAPAGGSVAAIVVALAAGLCVMSARLSTRQLPDAPDLAVRAEQLRDRAAALSQADAGVYGLVVSALREPDEPDPDGRRRGIAAALSRAADVPLEVAELGASVALLAARIAESGNQNLAGDAVTAALLAESGVRAAGALVSINLKDCEDDTRRDRAAELVEAAAASSARARLSIGF